MKILKFGKIEENEQGGITFSDFTFCPESEEEWQRGITEQNVVPCIIQFFTLRCELTEYLPLDNSSEMVVMKAIEKAKGGAVMGWPIALVAIALVISGAGVIAWMAWLDYRISKGGKDS